MEYRNELELLTTLSSDKIDQACAGEGLAALITHCYDEYLDLREKAEELPESFESRAFFLQEASAWRDTARVLKRIQAEFNAADAVESKSA